MISIPNEEREESHPNMLPACSFRHLLDYELRSSFILHLLKEFTILTEIWTVFIIFKTKRKFNRYEKNANPNNLHAAEHVDVSSDQL